jgi:low temperature requirement protein LtrA
MARAENERRRMVVVLRRRMNGRDPNETHRASTPLELLFDLCFVVAISMAAIELHHGIGEGHLGPFVLRYVLVFFAIWWGWVNFTWFASAYDTDDVAYRLLTLLQIAGVLVFAVGIPAGMGHFDFTVMVLGYVVMRVALIGQWLRAAREDPAGRPAAVRYAAGVGIVQLGWLGWLALPTAVAYPVFVVLAAAELVVPLWAEYRGTETSWHPEHIAERYGLFTIIVLGEAILGITESLQGALAGGGLSGTVAMLAIGGLLIVFGLWWAYFKAPAAEGLRGALRTTASWAYAHYVVYAGIAALGAGFEVAVDVATHHSEATPVTAAASIAVPLAAVVVVLVWLQRRLGFDSGEPVVLVGALLILGLAVAASAWNLGLCVLLMGVLLAAMVAVSLVAGARRGGVEVN